MTGCASSGLDGIPAQCVEAVSEAVALPNVVSLGRLEPLGSRPVEDGRDHVDDFISSLKLPVGEALIKSPPRLRVSPRILPTIPGFCHLCWRWRWPRLGACRRLQSLFLA